MKRLKYLLVYILPISVYFSFNTTGMMTFFPFMLFFGILPLFELFVKPNSSNFDKETAVYEKNNPVYDWILFLSVPVQISMLIYFLFIINETTFGTLDYFGKISSMGLMCGVLGINIGHELGHRSNRKQQFLGEILLLTSLNTHFLPYHNGGHHRDVATPNDAATAKKNQLLFVFWITSHFGSYAKAWSLENKLMKKQGRFFLTLNNRMVIYTFANILLLFGIFYFYNLSVLIAFIIAASLGILLLETVNYIEHYGLLRKKTENGKYERVSHIHSWNSDHPIGRLLLFNLSRHSDHHYNAGIKYPILKSIPQSPQMPTGYPGMMVLAIIQPIWFFIMNNKLEKEILKIEQKN